MELIIGQFGLEAKLEDEKMTTSYAKYTSLSRKIYFL